jgi:hypothetical protein
MRSRHSLNIAMAISCALLPACVSGRIVGNSSDLRASATRIGWLHGPCIALDHGGVAPGTEVTVVALGGPQRVLSAHIGGHASSDACPALQEDRREANLAGGLSFYRIEPLDEAMLAIGVVGALPVDASGAAPDLDGDGRSDTFGHCATAEGVRFFVRAGPESRGKPLWSGYYYLGYDLQPDCPDEP